MAGQCVFTIFGNFFDVRLKTIKNPPIIFVLVVFSSKIFLKTTNSSMATIEIKIFFFLKKL